MQAQPHPRSCSSAQSTPVHKSTETTSSVGFALHWGRKALPEEDALRLIPPFLQRTTLAAVLCPMPSHQQGPAGRSGGRGVLQHMSPDNTHDALARGGDTRFLIFRSRC